MRAIPILFWLGTVMCLLPDKASAVDIYVDASSTYNQGAVDVGTTWAKAFSNLESALATSVFGDDIHVAQGTYVPKLRSLTPHPNSWDWRFQIEDGVSMYGGYPTGGGMRDPVANPTILSGDQDLGNPFKNCNQVIRATQVDSSTIFDGFIVEGANAGFANWVYIGGAGMSLHMTSMTVKNCVFRNNDAIGQGTSRRAGGGLLINNDANPRIINCRFENNKAIEGGGLAVIEGASPYIVNCFFKGNTSTFGGAICVWNGASPYIVNCVAFDNYASAGGGAIAGMFSSEINVANSIFKEHDSPVTGGKEFYDFDGTWFPDIDVTNSNQSVSGGSTFNIDYSITEFTTSGTGNSTVDPNFVCTTGFYDGTGNYCFEAQNLSAYWNTGDNAYINASGVTTDYTENVPRIQFSTADIGLFEILEPCQPGNVIYVDVNATGLNIGCNWENAYTDLQSALSEAVEGQQIWVADGTYIPSTDKNGNVPGDEKLKTFRLVNEVEMIGGFEGFPTNETDPSQRNLSNLPVTLLSGEIQGDADKNNNVYNVVSSNLGTQATVMDGFTISHGNGSSANGYVGGGLRVSQGGVTVKNCIFIDNQGDHLSDRGGAVSLAGADAIFLDCHFENNEADNGGAVNIENYTTTYTNPKKYKASNSRFERCAFLNNHATDGNGGAVYYTTSGRSAAFIDCSFEGNHATEDGGGFWAGKRAYFAMEDCLFKSNEADGNGGGMSIDGQAFATRSKPKMKNVVFESNQADVAGGAVSFLGNTAVEIIGAMAWDNSAPYGGAFFSQEAWPIVTNATVYENTATTEGGAVFVVGDQANGAPVFNNTIFWGNTCTGAGEDEFELATSYGGQTYSTPKIGLSYCATEFYIDPTKEGLVSGTAPVFVNASNPKGADGAWGTGNDDGLRLNSGSNPALIDAGLGVYIPNSMAGDLEGNTRIQGNGVDMGAYEVAGGVYSEPSANGVSDVMGNFFSCSGFTSPTTTLTKDIVADFCAAGDGSTDDTKSFLAAAKWINDNSAPTTKIVLTIPAGDYKVGGQTTNSYNPGSLTCSGSTWNIDAQNNPNPASNGGNNSRHGLTVLPLSEAQNVHIQGSAGARLVLPDGIYYGGFDGSMQPSDDDESASGGVVIDMDDCDCVKVTDLELDGNIYGAIVGGKWDVVSTGSSFQLPYDGIQMRGSSQVMLEGLEVSNFGRSGVGILNKTAEGDISNNIVLREVKANWNASHGLVWTGGDRVFVEDCEFSYTGYSLHWNSTAGQYEGFYNNPGTGVNLEHHTGRVSYGFFENVDVLNNRGMELASSEYPGTAGWNVSNLSFKECTFWNKEFDEYPETGDIDVNVLWNNRIMLQPFHMRNTVFENCGFYGMIVRAGGTGDDDFLLFDKCHFSDIGPDGGYVQTINATILNFGAPIVSTTTQEITQAEWNDGFWDSYYQTVDGNNVTHYHGIRKDWNAHQNAYFTIRDSDLDFHYSMVTQMSSMAEESDVVSVAVYPQLRRFECNRFNFWSEELLNSPFRRMVDPGPPVVATPGLICNTGWGQIGLVGGIFANSYLQSNTFTDHTPVQPTVTGVNSEISWKCDSRYAFTVFTKYGLNTTDGNNSLLPKTDQSDPDHLTSPHTRIRRWINPNLPDAPIDDF